MRRDALQAQHDPVVRDLAEAICSGLPSKAYADEYVALYRFALSRCRYMRDPRNIELVRSPSYVARMLWSGRRPNLDCDDLATFLAALCLVVGGQCRYATMAFATMRHQGQLQYSHVCVQAFDPQSKAWVTLDPVAGYKTRRMLDRIKHVKFWPVG